MADRLARIDDRRENNFGVLRLVLAALVVVGHSPAMTGHYDQELLHGTFGNLNFGDVAVDGFFLISGYLITKSFLSPQPTSRFVVSRLLRLFPGYVVAFLVSFYVVGPLGGGDLSGGLGWNVFRQVATMALLKVPDVHGVFADQVFPSVNGPMWSLAQEFRCYALVLVLGLATGFRHRALFAMLALAGLCLLSFPSFAVVRLVSVFLCGMAFYLFRERIVFHWAGALSAAVAWFVLMNFRHLAEPATALFGGYMIFWFAFNVKLPALNRIGRRNDVSYGLYLYAWPIANLIIQRDPGIDPWSLTAVTVALAAGAGYLSWVLVEQPCLGMKDDPRLLRAVDRIADWVQAGLNPVHNTWATWSRR